MSADEVRALLAHLAAAERVAASTQRAIGTKRCFSKTMCLESRMDIAFCGQSFEDPRIYWPLAVLLWWLDVATAVRRKVWCYQSSPIRDGCAAFSAVPQSRRQRASFCGKLSRTPARHPVIRKKENNGGSYNRNNG